MDTVQFDLITPEKIFFSGSANQIDIPGSEGEFGVLVGHAPLISVLKAGVLTIYTPNEGTQRLFVAGGIAEVNASSCSVLAERVVALDSLSRSDAEKALVTSREKLDKSYDEASKASAAKEVEVAEAVLMVM